MLQRNTLRHVKDLFLVASGIGSAAFGLESFLLPANFIDGGATGVSLLLSELSNWHLSWLLLICNIPFVFLAYLVFNKRFALRTGASIAGLAMAIAFIHFPVVTNDKLLVAVFGGFFLGAGIGLAIRGGSVLDGTEVLAIFLSRKLSVTVGDIIIAINVLVFSAAAFLLSIETALYSMITYLAASKTLDFVLEGLEEYNGVTILSTYSRAIKEMIVREMGRGVTVYKGKGGYGTRGESAEREILFTVVTRLELNKLKNEINKIDRDAFVVINSVKDTKGGMIKKRAHGPG